MVTLKRVATPRPKGNTIGRVIGGFGPEGSHQPGKPAEDLGPAAREREQILERMEREAMPDQKIVAMLAGVLSTDAAWAKTRKARTERLDQALQQAGLRSNPAAAKADRDLQANQQQQERLKALSPPSGNRR